MSFIIIIIITYYSFTEEAIMYCDDQLSWSYSHTRAGIPLGHATPHSLFTIR